MRPDDFGRLGELMRRGGVWRGRRLLSKRFVREAIAPSATNGCYGWLIWVNAAAPCIGPTITDRPVTLTRDFPDLPADMYRFSGLFGQLVTSSRRQGIVVVRTGQDRGLLFAGGLGLGARPLRQGARAVTDQRISQARRRAPEPGGVAPERRLRLPDRALASPTSTARASPRTRSRPPAPRAPAPRACA